MRVSRSFTAAIALSLAAGCARQECPAAASPAPATVVVAPVTPTAAAVAAPQPVIAAKPARPTDDWKTTLIGSVRRDNQLPLNAAAVPFARYLNVIHNKIHPEFADKELEKLGELPFRHPLNNTTLVTRVELVLDGSTGAIVELLVVKPSGQAEFDALAVGATRRVAPFGEAPPAIRSADGKVYVHWEFHRDEVFACSTMHSRPFLLSGPPSIAL